MSEDTQLLQSHEPSSMCTNCKRVNSVDLIYVCRSGHSICQTCNMRLTRCLICLKGILDSPVFRCSHQGCDYKATYDLVRQHETDCDFKEFPCPFDGGRRECSWREPYLNLRRHLEQRHLADVSDCEHVEGDLPKRDRTWIISAFGEVFKCHVWLYEFDVDWVLRFVGPQKYSRNYTYEIKLYRPDMSVITESSAVCLGYNNVSIDPAVSFKVKDLKTHLAKTELKFSLRIINNKDHCSKIKY